MNKHISDKPDSLISSAVPLIPAHNRIHHYDARDYAINHTSADYLLRRTQKGLPRIQALVDDRLEDLWRRQGALYHDDTIPQPLWNHFCNSLKFIRLATQAKLFELDTSNPSGRIFYTDEDFIDELSAGSLHDVEAKRLALYLLHEGKDVNQPINQLATQTIVDRYNELRLTIEDSINALDDYEEGLITTGWQPPTRVDALHKDIRNFLETFRTEVNHFRDLIGEFIDMLPPPQRAGNAELARS